MKRLVAFILAMGIVWPAYAEPHRRWFGFRAHTDEMFHTKGGRHIFYKGHPYEITHQQLLLKHFCEVYMRWHGPVTWDKYEPDEYYPCRNPIASYEDTYDRIAKFKAQKLTYIEGDGSAYGYKTLVWKGFAFRYSLDYKTQQELRASGKTLVTGAPFHNMEQIIGWDDDHTLQGLFVSPFGGGKWHVVPVSHSISAYNLYPEEWWPWRKPTVDLEEKVIPYCGIVDDDLMYDFREENPFKTVLTHNKKGPFLYVYDFDLLRERMREWTVHDTLIHGWEAYGREEINNPARLGYGPVITNANHPAARAIRVQIFLKLYLAKLRIAKLLHPAPQWLEDKGDYTTKYSYRDNKEWVGKIDPNNATKAGLTMPQYVKLLTECPNEAYFEVIQDKVQIPTEVSEALKSKDWTTIKRVAKETQFSETMRDFYIYKMFVRSPIQKALDEKVYRSDRWLSIALWSGMSSCRDHRHQFIGGIKHYYPYFERKDKRGNSHISGAYDKKFCAFTGAPTNTAGLVYAGHMDEYEFENYCSMVGKSTDQVWTDALNGPFMIVSSRTYARYGHAYFEKLAGHPLKKVDVTGAVLESLSRVILNPDPDLVKQLIDMDYFYYKNGPADIRGTAAMKSVSSMTLTKVSKVADTDYDPIRVMRDPTSDPAIRPKDTSTQHFKAGAYDHIFRDVAKALAKDEKQFPGMSIRMMNYLPYHTKYPKPLYGPKEYKWGEMLSSRKETLSCQWPGEPVRYPNKTFLIESVRYLCDGNHGRLFIPDEIGQYVTLPTTPYGYPQYIVTNITNATIRASRVLAWTYARYSVGDEGDKEWINNLVKTMGHAYLFKDTHHELTDKEIKTRREIAYDYFAKRFFGMPRTPRHLDFIEELVRMKREGVVEKVGSQHELQVLISERIPWLAMNPNLFMAYYKHVDDLKVIFKSLMGFDLETSERMSGTGDGHLVWHFEVGKQGTGDAIMSALWEKHTSQTNWMLIDYGYLARPKGYILVAVAGGRLRKHPAGPEDFPKWLRFRPGISSALMHPLSMTYYNWPYRWMKGRSGAVLMLRDPEHIMCMYGSMSNVTGAAFYSKLMPGMTRFVESSIITLPLASYTGVWSKEGQFSHSQIPNLRGWMVEREYDVRTEIWAYYQAYISNKGKGFTLEAKATEARKHLAQLSSLLPRTGHTFVITDGIITSVTKAKGGCVGSKSISHLYEGLEQL